MRIERLVVHMEHALNVDHVSSVSFHPLEIFWHFVQTMRIEQCFLLFVTDISVHIVAKSAVHWRHVDAAGSSGYGRKAPTKF